MSAAQRVQRSEFEQTVLTSIWTGIGLVLVIPLIVSTDPFPATIFPFIVGKALFARLVIEVVFALWLVLALRYPQYRIPRSWLVLAFGVYLAVNVLTGVFGVSFQLSLWSTYERMQGIVDLAHWFAFILVLSAVARTWVNWRMLLNVNLAISLVMAVLGLAEYFGFDEAIPIYRTGGVSIFDNPSRLKITLGNATYVGAYMLVNSLVGLGFLVQSFLREARAKDMQAPARRRQRRRARSRQGEVDQALLWSRLFWLAVVVLDICVLILSGTRGAAIGLVAALVAFALAYILWGHTRRIKQASLALIVVLILGVAFVGLARNNSSLQDLSESNVMLRRLVSMDLEEGSVQSRFTTWRTGLQAFTARPILGWGPENFIIGWGRYYDDDPEIPETFDQAHNKLVEELTTKGILGFGTYMAIWVLMAVFVIRKVRLQREYDRVLTLFIGAALTGYFVQNLFLFDTPGTALQFFLLLGFVVFLEMSDRTVAAPQAGASPPDWMNRLASPIGAQWGKLSGALTEQRMSSVGALRTDRKQWYRLILAFAIVGLVAYYITYKPYSAGMAYVDSEVTPAWSERLFHMTSTMEIFPPMANQPRAFFLSRVTRGMDTMTFAEAEKTISIVEREMAKAFENEPEAWRLYTGVAVFYQRVSALNADYLDVAQTYLDRAAELAPGTVEVFVVQTQQELLVERMKRFGTTTPLSTPGK